MMARFDVLAVQPNFPKSTPGRSMPHGDISIPARLERNIAPGPSLAMMTLVTR
jgi:hypothetical protein